VLDLVVIGVMQVMALVGMIYDFHSIMPMCDTATPHTRFVLILTISLALLRYLNVRNI